MAEIADEPLTADLPLPDGGRPAQWRMALQEARA